jgi:hypothetical protein
MVSQTETTSEVQHILTLTPSEPTEIVNFRTDAGRSLREQNPRLPLVRGSENDDSVIDSDFINFVNGSENLREVRVNMVNAIYNSENRTDLFRSFIREMDQRTSDVILRIISSPATSESLRPLTNIIALGFSLGYSDTTLIIQDIFSSLPTPSGDGSNFEEIRTSIENIASNADQRANEANREAREEVEAAGSQGRARRNRMLANYGFRLAFGSSLFAGAAALIYAVGPGVLSNLNLGGLTGLPGLTSPSPTPSAIPGGGSGAASKTVADLFRWMANLFDGKDT